MSGIYIHIPFCKQACNYCNFHFSTSLKNKDDFLTAILKEIALTPYHRNELLISDKPIIETVYFGGGTPSILNLTDLESILDAIKKKFNITLDAEITLEANPDDINAEKLIGWKQAGVNRLSLGTQSFSEAELVWMNRAHTATDSLASLDLIEAAGFTNYSVDLIYGSPVLSNDDWKRNVDIVINRKIPHISCYALTVEPKTALDKLIDQKKKAPVDPEKQAEQFLLLMDWMEAAGYDHYEISNYALPGKRSQHNSSYWQGKNYYGFGPSAHAFDGESRQWNVANNALYIQSLEKDLIPFEKEMLTPTQQYNEYVMTALRTIEGIDTKKVTQQFGVTLFNHLNRSVEKYTRLQQLKTEGQHIKLTTEGKLFADGIAADLFF